MDKITHNTESDFNQVFTRVYKRIKAVMKSSNIDLMTKCEIYHIACSVKDTRDKQEELESSSVVNYQCTEALYRAEKAVDMIIKEKTVSLD